MEITVKNLQKKLPLNPPQIIRIVKAILLSGGGIKESTISVVFVTSQRITALNKKFLHKNNSTDVLAFNLGCPGDNNILCKGGGGALMGEIVISTDAVIQNSRIYETTLAQELILYVIHGILHLSGFDDHTVKDVKKMRLKEKEVLAYLGKRINAAIK